MLSKKPKRSMQHRKGTFIAIFLLGISVAFTAISSTTGRKINDSKVYLPAAENTILNSPSPEDTLPLLSIMTRLERDVNMISAGIWRHDFQMIKKGADNISHHPKIGPGQVKLIKNILGAEQFKEFVKTDKMVHQKAIEISKKANKQKLGITTELFLEMERGCISCHVDHRNKIVSSDNW